MEIKPFKMQVTPEQSERVQEILFKNGYKWAGGSNDIYMTDSNQLYFNGKELTQSSDIEWFRNKNLPEITYQQFIDMYDEFVLPEKWWIEVDEDNFKTLADWREAGAVGCMDYKNPDTSPSGYIYAPIGFWSHYSGDSQDEITFEQFKKYVLNKNKTMNKEIIGYRLVKQDFYKAASMIVFGNDAGCSWMKGRSYFRITAHDDAISKLEKAGVLDLWFEPVYKEVEEFKVGDWVKMVNINNPDGGTYTGVIGHVGRITEINSEGWIRLHPTCAGSTWKKENFVKATPEEIEASKNPTLPFGTSEVKIDGDAVKMDGYSASFLEIKFLYKSFTDSSLRGYRVQLDENTIIKIGCKSGTLKELAAIYNKMKSLRDE